MNKTTTFIWIFTIIALCGMSFILYKTSLNDSVNEIKPIFSADYIQTSDEFTDGLSNPDSVTTYPLDSIGTGVAQKSVYYVDINKDGKLDRITKTFNETGNAHSYYTYQIELNEKDKYIDITPDGLQTTNGEPCDLQQIQFQFKPNFKIITIYREMGDTWNTPTMAHKKTFTLDKNKMKETPEKNLRPICDVKELF